MVFEWKEVTKIQIRFDDSGNRRRLQSDNKESGFIYCAVRLALTCSLDAYATLRTVGLDLSQPRSASMFFAAQVKHGSALVLQSSKS
jgi:hypothetical protein